jgi:hypothetical protein
MSTRVFISTPMLAASRASSPARRATTVLPPNFPRQATITIAPQFVRFWRPLTSPIRVRIPVNAKNAGKRNTTTRSSSFCFMLLARSDFGSFGSFRVPTRCEGESPLPLLDQALDHSWARAGLQDDASDTRAPCLALGVVLHAALRNDPSSWKPCSGRRAVDTLQLVNAHGLRLSGSARRKGRRKRSKVTLPHAPDANSIDLVGSNPFDEFPPGRSSLAHVFNIMRPIAET